MWLLKNISVQEHIRKATEEFVSGVIKAQKDRSETEAVEHLTAGDSTLESGSDSTWFTLPAGLPVTPRRDDWMPE